MSAPMMPRALSSCHNETRVHARNDMSLGERVRSLLSGVFEFREDRKGLVSKGHASTEPTVLLVYGFKVEWVKNERGQPITTGSDTD